MSTDTGPKSLGEVLKDYVPTEIMTCKAGAAAIAKGAVVKLSAAMGTDGIPTVIITAANTDIVYGVALDAADAGKELRVLRFGYVKVTVVENVAIGVQLRAAAGGKLGTTGTGPLCAYAETAATGGDGSKIMAFICL